MLRWLIALGALMVGCGDEGATPAGEGGGGRSELVGGGGEPGCPPGTMPLDDGACLEAGVPEGACDEGFVSDGAHGCEPILPTSCGAGTMAVPGEARCREVAPCGNAPWGDIAVAADTQYVDAAYGALDSDGSAAKPWLSIADGISAAVIGATVAVAAGSYAENLVIQKSITVAGRCPALVEVVGSGSFPVVSVLLGADQAVVRGLAITGAAAGVVVSGASEVALRQLWIHDTASRGVSFQDTYGPTSGALEDSLVEHVAKLGVYLLSADVTVERSVVRDSQIAAGELGRGINIQRSTAFRPSVVVRRSVIEFNREAAVFSSGGELVIEGSVVRGTTAPIGGVDAKGVTSQYDFGSMDGGVTTIRGSLIEGTEGSAVVAAGAELHFERSVARSSTPDLQQLRGWGIALHETAGHRATAQVRSSLIDGNTQVGIACIGSDAAIDNTRIRATVASVTHDSGGGLVTMTGTDTSQRPVVALRWSTLHDNAFIGAHLAACDASLESVALMRSQPAANGDMGLGVYVNGTQSERSSAVLRHVLIEDNIEHGLLAFDSDVDLDDVVVLGTTPGAAGLYGDGITIALSAAPPTALLRRCQSHSNARAGISSFGASVTLADATLSCNVFDLDAEQNHGVDAVYIDEGGNRCGCGDAYSECKAQSAAIDPPQPLPADP
jgi:hypothetical protein